MFLFGLNKKNLKNADATQLDGESTVRGYRAVLEISLSFCQSSIESAVNFPPNLFLRCQLKFFLQSPLLFPHSRESVDSP